MLQRIDYRFLLSASDLCMTREARHSNSPTPATANRLLPFRKFMQATQNKAAQARP